MLTVVLPSSEETIEVRPLRFLELEDEVQYRVAGPYQHAYLIEAGNQTAVQMTPYELGDWEKPPQKPDVPRDEVVPGSEAEGRWIAWDLWRAVVVHEEARAEERVSYCIESAQHILENCIRPEDKDKITGPEDYAAVLLAVLAKEVTMEDIEAEMASTFPGLLEGRAFTGGLRSAIEGWRELFDYPPVGDRADDQPEPAAG